MSDKSKRQSLVPQLRFPEFREKGEWIDSTLGDIATIKSGGTPSRSKIDFWNGNIPWITTSLINFNIINTANEYISDAGIQESSAKLFPKNTILMAMYGQGITRGKVAILGIEATTNQACAAIILKKGLNTNFVFQNLASRYNDIRNISNEGGQKNLSTTLIKNIPFLHPDNKTNEQKKIAKCLTSLDQLITTQTQKLDSLKAHKKGLMQQLFPAEGETVPKLRFAEFRDAGEWEEKILGKVAIFSKGRGISKADISPSGSQACIRYGELYTHYKETINPVISYTNIPSDKLILSQKNDVIIPASGETQIDIATASCVLKSDIALGSDLNIIRTKMNGVFLSYYLNGTKKKDIAVMAQGIVVVHLYANQLKTLKINIPKKTEQQEIANCLTSLDELITTQTKKIDTLKAHKKGLMQQLFPSTNEEDE